MNDQVKTRGISVTGDFSRYDFLELLAVLRAFRKDVLKRGTCPYMAIDFEPVDCERNGEKQPDSDLIK